MYSIRAKYNFSPAVVKSCGIGDSDNENVVDGLLLASSPSDKYTISDREALDPLNHPTPFIGVPEVVEGSEN